MLLLHGSEIATVVPADGIVADLIRFRASRPPSGADLSEFFRSMHNCLSMGDSLPFAIDHTLPLTKNLRLRWRAAQVASSLRESTLSPEQSIAFLEDVIGPDFVAMIQAAFHAGDLPKTFRLLSEVSDKRLSVTKGIKKSLIYPSIVLVVGLISVFTLSVTFFPKMVDLYKGLGSDLPPTTAAIISATSFLQTHWIFSVLLGTGLLFGIFRIPTLYARSPGFQAMVDRIPYLRKLIFLANFSRALRTLAMLRESNIPIQDALEMASRTVVLSRLRKYFLAVRRDILDGVGLFQAFAKHRDALGLEGYSFSMFIHQAEETGMFADIIDRLAEQYEESVDATVSIFGQFIQPIFIAAIGLITGVVLISVFEPLSAMNALIPM